MSHELAEVIEEAAAAVATALRARSSTGLAKVERRLSERAVSDPGWADALTALADVCRAVREFDEFRGTARPGRGLEPESLAARLLAEVERGARVGNADLAELLQTDQWQLSRAGRRLRDLGLVTRSRHGRVNVWDLTDGGREELGRLRAAPQRRGARTRSGERRNAPH